jgi:hypothetical protein
MRWTKTVLVAVSIGAVVCGCSGESTTGEDDPLAHISWSEYLEGRTESKELVLVQGDAGRIHNEVLVAFDKRRPLSDASEMSRAEFAGLFAAAANDVNTAHGVEATVEDTDAFAMMGFLDELFKVYDAWGYTLNQDPFTAIKYLHDNGYISNAENEELRNLVDAYYDSRARGTRPALTFALNQAASSQSVLVRDAASLLAASSEFWEKSDAPAAASYQNIRSLVHPDLYIARTITDVMVGLCWASMFPFFAGMANHVAVLGSLAFHAMITYMPPNDNYEVPLWADPSL